MKLNGQPMLIMPSEDYIAPTDVDVGAIVAFVDNAAGFGNCVAEFRALIVRGLYAAGVIKDAAGRRSTTSFRRRRRSPRATSSAWVMSRPAAMGATTLRSAADGLGRAAGAGLLPPT